MRLDADSTEVQAVGIPAGLQGGVSRAATVAVPFDGVAERVELPALQIEVAAVERARERRTALPVMAISTLVLTAAVMQKGEELHHEEVRPALSAHGQPMVKYAGPMIGAVVAMPVNPKLRTHVSKKRTGCVPL